MWACQYGGGNSVLVYRASIQPARIEVRSTAGDHLYDGLDLGRRGRHVRRYVQQFPLVLPLVIGGTIDIGAVPIKPNPGCVCGGTPDPALECGGLVGNLIDVDGGSLCQAAQPHHYHQPL